ncbi:MAG: hypothetical protein ABH879_09340 [archaeon]
MKRGQGISLNVLVLAALAIIVMIILVAILTGNARKFVGSLGSDCDETDIIKCIPMGECNTNGGIVTTKECPDAGVCCNLKPLGAAADDAEESAE